MARSIAENNSRNLWTECRKISQKIANSPNCMDTFVGDKNITELFGHKYDELYNSVSYDKDEFLTLQKENDYNIELYCIDNVYHKSSNHIHTLHTHDITVEHVTNAITHLKSEKNDNFEGLTSDNIKNGTHLLNVYISLLFSTMLSYGTAPAGLLLSTLVPQIKNKRGNKCDSNNYRAIAISSIIGKLIDTVLLKLQHDNLFTDSLQFGFKPNSSTVICTSLLRDTIEYYNDNGSDCYLLLLDASKAFDRIEYVRLFRTLSDRNMCPIVPRLLTNMYINQSFQVKWNNIISSQSHVSNGVKQGGCLSPTLFSVYLNELNETIRKNNISCRYGSEYMGVFCYADDLSLLCPSYTGIKEILKNCEDYAMKHNILFNTKKSQCLLLIINLEYQLNQY